jgi:hypothetical protein
MVIDSQPLHSVLAVSVSLLVFAVQGRGGRKSVTVTSYGLLVSSIVEQRRPKSSRGGRANYLS